MIWNSLVHDSLEFAVNTLTKDIRQLQYISHSNNVMSLQIKFSERLDLFKSVSSFDKLISILNELRATTLYNYHFGKYLPTWDSILWIQFNIKSSLISRYVLVHHLQGITLRNDISYVSIDVSIISSIEEKGARSVGLS